MVLMWVKGMAPESVLSDGLQLRSFLGGAHVGHWGGIAGVVRAGGIETDVAIQAHTAPSRRDFFMIPSICSLLFRPVVILVEDRFGGLYAGPGWESLMWVKWMEPEPDVIHIAGIVRFV